MKRFVKFLSFCFAALLVSAVLSGCAGGKDTVVIYSNADEEAQAAMKNALDQAGYGGQYIMQSFGTSELGGKLLAEGKNIEADLVTMSSYYLDSAQTAQNMFADLTFDAQPLTSCPAYYKPLTAQAGAIFVNMDVLAKEGIARPQTILDLAKPEYKGHISVPSLTGSSTAWLLAQAAFDAYGEKEGAEVLKAIMANAGPHLESSGSAPLKKLRAGEVAVGFGLRHQVVADKKSGLPLDYVDPIEGNFVLTESVAVVKKGGNKETLAMKMSEVLAKQARAEILKSYPTPLYAGESVDTVDRPAYPKQYKEPLTAELLKKHQELVK